MSIKNKNVPAPDAIILHANYAVFAPGKILHIGQVQSRMLLWCKSGKGIITLNGETFPFSAGNFLFTPWNHIIRYAADKKAPFLLAGIHIVPELKECGNINYTIYHRERNDLAEYRKRHDIDIPELPSVFSGSLFLIPALEALAEYTVAWFEQYPRAEFMARNLAAALLYELIRAQEKQSGFSEIIPHHLKTILIFIENNIENNIEMPILAKLANGSRSTVFRLFRKHLDCTPGYWILKRKMERARELLKKTDLRVGEIGEKISINDPYYFSKLFKKFTGLSAREYRNERLFIK
ncbi:MAG: AraC family transcriptional regulator [Victivallaceae bacterium]|nr:AraC family transcriptional regulator [Victivallaceae bacterium]